MIESVKIENINKFLVKNRIRLLEKKFFIEMFTSTDYDILPDELKENNTEWIRTKDDISTIIIKGSSNPKKHKGNIYNFSENADVWNIYGCADVIDDNSLVFYNLKKCKPYSSIRGIIDLNDELILEKDMIENYNDDNKLLTTYGLYFLNYILFAKPFKDKIEYINYDTWNIGKIEDRLASLIIEDVITVDEFREYYNNGSAFFYNGEFCVPTLTKKSLVTDPNVKEKKATLIEENKDRLHDPTVLSKIENETIKIDKHWLKDDPSMDFFISGASYDNHRKKMFITGGLVESFKQGAKEYNFINEPLSSGWQMEDIPIRANEIRKASYGRGIKTAEGGTLVKQIMRIMQNLNIVEEDCGTTQGLKLVLDEYFIKSFFNRYLIHPKLGLVLLTNKNYKDYIDKPVHIRSPMGCKSKHGLCYKCCGKTMESLNVKAIGLQTTAIGSTIMNVAMKTMHTTTVNLFDASDIEKFIFRSDTHG